MINKYLQGVHDKYEVDQANLIRNIKDFLHYILLSPFSELRESKGKLLYKSCKITNQSC